MARWGVAVTYLLLGVEHILLGPDHLIFVLLLVLLVRSPALLLATITGFTVGHSVTLVMAVLGVVNVPGPPVEALIALSIVQLASEVVVQNDTGDAAVARRPWLVSSVFGLLHGLGFAGALAETGLPSTGLPLALATFNVGVELGQLLFVAVVLGLMWLTPRRRRAGVATAMAWLAGLVAGYWLVERTVALLG
jgi:hydrogenase/urease accessory protein HupE